jgi:hypothetical protein
MITEEQKVAILESATKAVETGEAFVEAIEAMHALTKKFTSEQVDEIIDTYPEFQLAQADMDKLHVKLVEIGIA